MFYVKLYQFFKSPIKNYSIHSMLDTFLSSKLAGFTNEIPVTSNALLQRQL